MSPHESINSGGRDAASEYDESVDRLVRSSFPEIFHRQYPGRDFVSGADWRSW